MAYLTGQTAQGCCVGVRYEDGVFHCAPNVPAFIFEAGVTNTWTQFFAKAVGQPGELVRIRLHWPKYIPAGVPEGANQYRTQSIAWDDEFGYFLYPARDIVFFSEDRVHWTRLEDVTLDGTDLCFSARLTGEAGWFSVCLYYTPENYRDLRQTLRGSRWIRELELGRDMGGDVIYAYEATDPDVPREAKTNLYLQAAQHCCEYMGAHLCDYLLRWLAQGSQEARRLMGRYRFHVVPVVSVSSWRQGLFVHELQNGLYLTNENGNPARDWIEKKLPTTQAVDRYLRSLSPAPALLLDIHSGITNYGNKTICQSITVNENLPEARREAMKRFVYTVHERCDFLPARRYWEGIEDPRLFERYAQEQFGQAHTVEISQFAIYDRALGRHLPQNQAGLARFASQLPGAIDAFLTEEAARSQQ